MTRTKQTIHNTSKALAAMSTAAGAPGRKAGPKVSAKAAASATDESTIKPVIDREGKTRKRRRAPGKRQLQLIRKLQRDPFSMVNWCGKALLKMVRTTLDNDVHVGVNAICKDAKKCIIAYGREFATHYLRIVDDVTSNRGFAGRKTKIARPVPKDLQLADKYK